jgi:hypothetical protein
MSFEVVPRGVFSVATPLAEGQAALGKSGKLRLRCSDLGRAGIKDVCVVLADVELLRIALRRTRSGEENVSMRVSPVGHKNRKPGSSVAINVARAIRRLGLEAASLAGRYELSAKGPDGDALLIVALADLSGVVAKSKKEPKAK